MDGFVSPFAVALYGFAAGFVLVAAWLLRPWKRGERP